MRVATCGLTTLDLIQYVDRLPGPNEKTQASSARLEFGGPAANAAFTAHSLGAQTHLLTALGDGPLSQIAGRQLRDEGITVIDAAAGAWDVPLSSVAVTSEGRAVISLNGGIPAPLRPTTCVGDLDALLVDGHHMGLCLTMARDARALGVPVLLDGGSWKPGLEQLMPLLDAVVVSADFTGPLPEVPVAVTRGQGPISYQWQGGRGEIEVSPVPDPDTLGAGDVFHGAWLVHVAQHGLDDFPAGLAFAAEIASASCRWPGAHEWARHFSGAHQCSGLPSIHDA
jgi:sugar/nucleoside kinase (ribokinase family)